MFDANFIRKDFPILERQVHGVPLVYLDNAATSQKPRAVIDALSHYYEHYNANVHRGVHCLAEEATSAFEESREKVAAFINAPSAASVIFTRNTTEAINLAAHAWGRKFLGPGDEIIITEMEHHSNIIPWQLVAQDTGAVLKFITINEDGRLNLDELDSLLTSRTKLVCIVHMSNTLGTINPAKEIAKMCHSRGALLLLDGAQSVPHLPIDVTDLDCDFLAFSGHKMLGPTGIGVLYGKEDILLEMDPFLGGGEMIREVWLDHATYKEPPWRFEAGTPNIADTIALGVAIDYLNALGMEAVRAHEIELTQYALKLLSQVDGLKIYGPKDANSRGGAISFNMDGIHPHDVGTVLDQQGIAIRAGHHCTQPLMRKLGVAATARASFYIYNTREEIESLAIASEKVKEFFAHATRRVGRSI